MANAKCLWIAAALSVSGAEGARTANGRKEWTGASRMDHTGSIVELTRGRDGRSQDGRAPQTGHSERILPGPNCPRNSLQYSFVSTDTHRTSDRRSPYISNPLQSNGLHRDRRVSHIEHHSRSLSHLSLTLWCVAPRSGWLGSCASPPRRRERERALGTPAPGRDGPPGKAGRVL